MKVYSKRISPKAQARLDFEKAHGWAKLLASYGWHVVKWTKTGRPCWFTYGLTRNEFWWQHRTCLVIGSRNAKGTSWSLRHCHKWVDVKSAHNAMVPLLTEVPVVFQTAVGVALWHQLFKPELPK